jgi:hypothetical protein
MSTRIGGYRDLPPGNVQGKKDDGSVRAPGEMEPGMERIQRDLKSLQSVLQNLEAFDRKGWRAEDVLSSEVLYLKVSQQVPAGFNLDKLKDYLEMLDPRKKLKIKK